MLFSGSNKKKLSSLIVIGIILLTVVAFVHALDVTPPVWQNQGQSASTCVAGGTNVMYAQGKDETGLRKAVLSTNETGTWANYTGLLNTWTDTFSDTSKITSLVNTTVETGDVHLAAGGWVNTEGWILVDRFNRADSAIVGKAEYPQTDWSKSGGTISISNNTLKIVGGGAGVTAMATQSYSASTTYTVEGNASFAQVSDWPAMAALDYSPAPNPRLALTAKSTSYIHYLASAGWVQTTKAYSANVSYNYRIVVYPSTQKVDYYFDGTLLAANASWYTGGGAQAPNVLRISQYNTAATFYVDEIFIYNGTTKPAVYPSFGGMVSSGTVQSVSIQKSQSDNWEKFYASHALDPLQGNVTYRILGYQNTEGWILLDRFDRLDSASMGSVEFSTSSAWSWNQQSGAFSIRGNRLKVTGGNSPSDNARVNFTGTSVYTVEGKVNFSQTNQEILVFAGLDYDVDVNRLAMAAKNDGFIYYLAGSAWTNSSQKYEANVIYDFKIVVDTGAKTGDFYFNGTLIGNDKSYFGGTSDPRLLRVSAYNSLGTFYVEEIMIYSGTTKPSQYPSSTSLFGDITEAQAQAGFDISSSAASAISLFALLESYNASYTPAIHDWTVTWTGGVIYGSPMDLGSVADTWVWSNFTWHNSSVAVGSTVAWKIWYSDTSNNWAETSEMTFRVIPTPPSPPANPILVVISSSGSVFGKYTGEILNTEGFNEYQIENLTSIDESYLSNFNVVILNYVNLTSDQRAMFLNYVYNGGNLIAFKPDKQLASALGLTPQNTTTYHGYLLVDNSTGIGKGIVGETIQNKGTADNYALNTATMVATLYTNATNPTPYPAVASMSYGSGKAVIFTYDLPQSIAYQRQGNPDWANQERDGYAGIRPVDMFIGQDGDANYVDFNKVPIPQADEQQRLLANAILTVSQNPLPRLWYLPDKRKAMVVMTGDTDGNPAASVINQQLSDAESYGGYWTENFISNVYSVSDESNWRSRGHETTIHPTTSSSYSAMNAAYDTYVSSFYTMYGHYPTTVRNHAVVWYGWAETAEIQANHGIRGETDYYHGAQMNNTQGYLTGSGLPQRFVYLNGTIIYNYQLLTEWADETQGSALSTICPDMFEKSQNGYYSTFVANFHPGSWGGMRATGLSIMSYAQSHGIPIWSAEKLVGFWDARHNATFNNVIFSGSELDFRLVLPDTVENLTVMIPNHYGTKLVNTIRVNGTSKAFSTETIKGIEYAWLVINSIGTYEFNVTYAAPFVDVYPPLWRSQGQEKNQILMNGSNSLFAEAYDETALKQAVLSTNETGTWKNYTTSGSNWWNSDYNYRKRVTITNTAGSTMQANSLISITLDHASLVSAGKSLSSGDDVRVVYGNSTELARTNDTAFNSATTKLTFHLQNTIPASSSDSDYYVYYGKPTAANPPTSLGIVALWHFDEGSGLSTYDSSGNGATGALSASGVSWTTGKYGSAVSFDGTGGVVSMGDRGYLIGENYTYEFWAKVNTLTGPHNFFSKAAATTPIYGVIVTQLDKQLHVYVDSPTGSAQWMVDNVFTATDTWYHIVVVLVQNTKTIKVYKDGSLLTPSTGGTYSSLGTTTESFQVGRRLTTYHYLNGMVDELVITNTSTPLFYKLLSDPTVTLATEQAYEPPLHGSPIDMGNVSLTWVWSNFTWQNALVFEGTTVSWRIYYEDAAGNWNATDMMSFRILLLQPGLEMDPSTVTCRKLHENFAINITVTNVLDATDFAFEIQYNATLLGYVDLTWGNFLSGTKVIDSIDELAGVIAGHIEPGTPASGSGMLLGIEFQSNKTLIWKDGQENELQGQIWFHWAKLSYSTGSDQWYEEWDGGRREITVSSVNYMYLPIQGDVDNDGSVNIWDLRTVGAFYDVQLGDPDWPTASNYDLNGDGIIGIFDLVVVGANFGARYNP